MESLTQLPFHFIIQSVFGGIPFIQQPSGIVDERQKGGLLGFGRLEKRGHVPEGDCEQVAGAHRVEVIPGVGEIP